MSLASESKLAAIGIDSILRGEPTLNKEQQNDAKALPARIRALLLRFLSGATTKESEFPEFDYDAIKPLLEGQGEAQAHALDATDPDPEVHADATRAIDYLQKSLPRRVTKTTVKQTILPPEPFEMGRFRRKWMVACRPLDVLDDLCDGSIDTGMVAALRAMFPEIYRSIAMPGGAVDNAIATMKTRRGDDFDITGDRDALLRVLLQADGGVDMDLANDYARVAAQVPAPEPTNKPKPKELNIKSGEALPGQVSATAKE